jgi:hypothetical protein
MVSSFVSSSNPAVQVISPLVWQQITMGYSLISSLLIALMPFLKSFHTGMGVDVRNLTYIGSSNSGRDGSRQYGYRLEQLVKSSKNSNTVTTIPAEDEQALATARWTNALPRQVSSKSRIEAGTSATTVANPNVIQKTVDWSVQYDSSSHQ